MQQLELFETDKKSELDQIKDEWNRTRKALFMQNADLKKRLSELSHDHELMKMHICKGRIAI